MRVHVRSVAQGDQIQEILKDMTSQRTVPNVFINGKHIGGCDSVMKLAKSNELLTTVAAK